MTRMLWFESAINQSIINIIYFITLENMYCRDDRKNIVNYTFADTWFVNVEKFDSKSMPYPLWKIILGFLQNKW